MPMTAEQAYAALISQPLSFLRTYRVRVTYSQETSGPADVSMFVEQQNFDGKESFQIAQAPPDGSDSFPIHVYYLHMLVRNEILVGSVPGSQPTVGPDAPQLLVTGPLSGCSLMYQYTPPLHVAHIKPASAMVAVEGGYEMRVIQTGDALQRDLQEHGRFRGVAGGEPSVYGRIDYGPLFQAQALGRRTDVWNVWGLYVQKQDLGNRTLVGAEKLKE